MERYQYTPSQIDGISGVSPEAQRDWRHKGYLVNYGLQLASTRWVYSTRDVVAFWLAQRLMRSWDRHTSCAVAWTHAPRLIGFMKGEAGPRYVAHLHGEEKGGGYGSEAKPLVSLSELELMQFDRVEVVDLRQIADTAPKSVRAAAMREPDINPNSYDRNR